MYQAKLHNKLSLNIFWNVLIEKKIKNLVAKIYKCLLKLHKINKRLVSLLKVRYNFIDCFATHQKVYFVIR